MDFSGTIDQLENFKGIYSQDKDQSDKYLKKANKNLCLWRAKEKKTWVMGNCDNFPEFSGYVKIVSLFILSFQLVK